MSNDFTDDPLTSINNELSDESVTDESVIDDSKKPDNTAHNPETRKRIEQLQEEKRLRELLDDVDNWDI